VPAIASGRWIDRFVPDNVPLASWCYPADGVGNRRLRGSDGEIGDVKTHPRIGSAVEQDQAVLACCEKADALRRTVSG
jgi:hypothetical protein